MYPGRTYSILYIELNNYGCMETCVMVTTLHALSVVIRFLTICAQLSIRLAIFSKT